MEINGKTFELFLAREAIAKCIRLMGMQLNVDYENKRPIFIGVLSGSYLFMADLVREFEGACEMAFVKVASYQGTSSSGKIQELLALPENLKNRDVILVEDIIDTGNTLKHILAQIAIQQPASVAICSLLYKPRAIKHPFDERRYIGFEIPNDFVVGYGLDYDGFGRNLQDIFRAL